MLFSNVFHTIGGGSYAPIQRTVIEADAHGRVTVITEVKGKFGWNPVSVVRMPEHVKGMERCGMKKWDATRMMLMAREAANRER